MQLPPVHFFFSFVMLNYGKMVDLERVQPIAVNVLHGFVLQPHGAGLGVRKLADMF